jgi:hypothetical protein
MLPMMKRGNEAIGSKGSLNFPLENCPEVWTFAFSSGGKKLHFPSFLAIVTSS